MTNELSSPICYGPQADDAYMGYAPRDEILAALKELLEAERAGARVALASARSEAASPYRDLMLAVRADEARWCAMLSGQIKRLGGTPSRKTGGFYAKALAISGALDRLAFLNRGQGWIVRKLEALTPRIRDEILYADLRAMLDSHRTNIDRACGLLDPKSDADARLKL
ncbi:MAG: DUF6306 domain-containing protein [Sphingobium sp.]